MRFVNLDGRMTLVAEDGRGIDVADGSGGALPSSPGSALDRWADVCAWAREQDGHGGVEIAEERLGPPSPHPRQIFGVGLNYASHAAEAGMEVPAHPLIFTKLQSALAGPFGAIPISSASVDWEIELVVVMGRRARAIPTAEAWDHVAGITVGQDLSEREIQMRPAGMPQFTLGKSLPGFGPIGPALVTRDELAQPDDLELVCAIDGEEVQRGRTSDLIFSVPELIEYLSGVTILYPGDLLFTGTPPGVGSARTPPRFLRPANVLTSTITGVGTMRHELADGAAPA